MEILSESNIKFNKNDKKDILMNLIEENKLDIK